MDGGMDPTADGAAAAALRDVALADRYDLGKGTILLSGVQALVRLALAQRARDQAAALKTAGYITGYRGSPLGGLDMAAARAQGALEAADIIVEPALNEDLAATAIWGAQSAPLFGRGRVDGAFCLWYGKGPGVDRSGDALRHGNLAGASALGGVLLAAGDDHTCESSTTCHQSDFALVDAQCPVLHPAGPQEILDFGLYGWALSRLTGCWVGLKCLKDAAEATTVIDGRLGRLDIQLPDAPMPAEGLNLVPGESPQAQEARLLEWRLPAVAPFVRMNGLDGRRLGAPGARIGVAASGKSWLDLLDALELLGLDAAGLERVGLSAYKVGMAWPLDGASLSGFAAGLETLLVVEGKRSLIETQAKEALYGVPGAPRIFGKTGRDGRPLLPATLDLSPLDVAAALGALLLEAHPEDAALAAALARVERARSERPDAAPVTRQPYFCSGCPHNSSTVVPEGSRAGAGIGCHYLAKWMDRETGAHTHMGGEGAQWIGEGKFSKDGHIFQNIGDGTYNHSGLMAIRAAVAANATITYKILYNDAVAMTGGQGNDGGLTPEKIGRELRGVGVDKIAVVVDPKEQDSLDPAGFPRGVEFYGRSRLGAVQQRFAEVKGVSAIIYVQTCAAEKRRRRKRGAFPEAPSRVMINPSVCEGCGDCGAASNCVSILPLETEEGVKRRIDQSSCNMDYACIQGFCPSFVTVKGATLRKGGGRAADLSGLPEPTPPAVGGNAGRSTTNLLITGVGGTGVVTIGALIGMAAHLEGKGVGVIEMAGLAQKGGSVHIHARIAARPEDVSAIRVGAGQADVLIGGDLVVSADAKTLVALDPERTRGVLNTAEMTTGAFTRDPSFRVPGEALTERVTARLGANAPLAFDATALAEALLGDAIYANMLLLGAAWQSGFVPLGAAALRRAIELNGAAVAENLRAFEIGRWAAARPDEAQAVLDARRGPEPEAETLDAAIARRAAYLTAYQSEAWAQRYRDGVAAARRAEDAVAPGSELFTAAAAASLFKLMSYKDEYEVARLHAAETERMAEAMFEGVSGYSFHFAPSWLAIKGADGRPQKVTVGSWALPLLKLLRHGKHLRGGALDVFGFSAERRRERQMIWDFEADLTRLCRLLRRETIEIAAQIARTPQSVKGYGYIKDAAAEQAAARRAELFAAFDAATEQREAA